MPLSDAWPWTNELGHISSAAGCCSDAPLPSVSTCSPSFLAAQRAARASFRPMAPANAAARNFEESGTRANQRTASPAGSGRLRRPCSPPQTPASPTKVPIPGLPVHPRPNPQLPFPLPPDAAIVWATKNREDIRRPLAFHAARRRAVDGRHVVVSRERSWVDDVHRLSRKRSQR